MSIQCLLVEENKQSDFSPFVPNKYNSVYDPSESYMSLRLGKTESTCYTERLWRFLLRRYGSSYILIVLRQGDFAKNETVIVALSRQNCASHAEFYVNWRMGHISLRRYFVWSYKEISMMNIIIKMVESIEIGSGLLVMIIEL